MSAYNITGLLLLEKILDKLRKQETAKESEVKWYACTTSKEKEVALIKHYYGYTVHRFN